MGGGTKKKKNRLPTETRTVQNGPLRIVFRQLWRHFLYGKKKFAVLRISFSISEVVSGGSPSAWVPAVSLITGGQASWGGRIGLVFPLSLGTPSPPELACSKRGVFVFAPPTHGPGDSSKIAPSNFFVARDSGPHVGSGTALRMEKVHRGKRG